MNDYQKGYITINAPNNAIAIPAGFTLTLPDGTEQTGNIAGFPHTFAGLEQNGLHQIMIIDANGKQCPLTHNLTPRTSGCDDTSLTAPNPHFNALCTDSSVNIMPTLPDGVRIKSVTQPPHGTVAPNLSGTNLTYQPEDNWSGTVTVAYQIEDTSNGNTGSGTITITVGCNQGIGGGGETGSGPDVYKSIYCTSGEVDVTPALPNGYTLIDITTPNGNLQYGGWKSEELPEKIVYVVNSGSGQNGTVVESFGYVAEDAQGNTIEGAIEITIGCPAPVAPTLHISIPCDEESVGIFSEAIWQQIEDANPHSAIHVKASGMGNGTHGVTDYIESEWVYILNNNNATSDRITYQIQDNAGQTDFGVINITITSTDTCGGEEVAPAIEVSSCGEAVELPIVIPQGYALSALDVPDGSEALPENGVIMLYLPEGFSEGFSFTYSLQNNNTGETASNTITVNKSEDCSTCIEDMSVSYTYNNGQFVLDASGAEDIAILVNGQSVTSGQTVSAPDECKYSVFFVLDRTGSMESGVCAEELVKGTYVYPISGGQASSGVSADIDYPNYRLEFIYTPSGGSQVTESIDFDSPIVDLKEYVNDTYLPSIGADANNIDNLTVRVYQVFADGSCLDKVKAGTTAMLQSIAATSGNKWSVVTFNNNADLLVDLSSSNVQAAIDAVNGIESGNTTNICAGLEMAKTQIAADTSNNVKVLILLTDGVPNAGGCEKSNVVTLANQIKASGVQVVTMGINMDSPTYQNTPGNCGSFDNNGTSGNMMVCSASLKDDGTPFYYDLDNNSDIEATFNEVFAGFVCAFPVKVTACEGAYELNFMVSSNNQGTCTVTYNEGQAASIDCN